MAVTPRTDTQRRFPDERSAQLGELMEPTVTSHGLYLEEVTLKPSGTGTQLKVVVDYLSGTENVDLDTVAGLSQALNVVLDAHAETGVLASVDRYDLEVSTPGANRPLTQPRHFERNIGRLLEIDRAEEPTLNARLQQVDEDSIVVTEIRPGAKKGMPAKVGPETRIDYVSITRARVQVEFSHDGQN